MKELLSNRKILYIIIFMHTLFFLFALVFIKYQSEKNIEKYINNLYIENDVSFHKAINILNKNMDLIEKLLIDKNILKIVADADQNITKARKKLIDVFYDKYDILKKHGFYLIHFHLKNGTSFVRFHRLNKFGDNLYSFRPAIRYVQEYGKTFHGFELGRGIGGFRSIYPLFYKGEFIGSFEISFSFNNLIKYIFENEKMALLLNKKYVNKVIYKKDLKKLKKCKLNEDFYIWGNTCKVFNKKNYNKKIDFSKKINIIEDKLVFSYPVKDLQGKREGYILIVKNLNKIYVINEIKKNYNRLQLFIIILYLVILIMIIGVHVYYKSKIKAEIDYLTKVYNRNGCLSRIRHMDDYTLMILDIDFFKKINDEYGHDIGDKILKELAEILLENVRKDSDVVCRWGGEEFLIVLKTTDFENVVKVAEKIRKIVENHDFGGITITVSIGVNRFKDSFEKTFKLADIKLYQAKKSGRNRVVY